MPSFPSYDGRLVSGLFLFEDLRDMRGCASRDLRRVTNTVSATPAFVIINIDCFLLKTSV